MDEEIRTQTMNKSTTYPDVCFPSSRTLVFRDTPELTGSRFAVAVVEGCGGKKVKKNVIYLFAFEERKN